MSPGQEGPMHFKNFASLGLVMLLSGATPVTSPVAAPATGDVTGVAPLKSITKPRDAKFLKCIGPSCPGLIADLSEPGRRAGNGPVSGSQRSRDSNLRARRTRLRCRAGQQIVKNRSGGAGGIRTSDI